MYKEEIAKFATFFSFGLIVYIGLILLFGFTTDIEKQNACIKYAETGEFHKYSLASCPKKTIEEFIICTASGKRCSYSYYTPLQEKFFTPAQYCWNYFKKSFIEDINNKSWISEKFSAICESLFMKWLIAVGIVFFVVYAGVPFLREKIKYYNFITIIRNVMIFFVLLFIAPTPLYLFIPFIDDRFDLFGSSVVIFVGTIGCVVDFYIIKYWNKIFLSIKRD